MKLNLFVGVAYGDAGSAPILLRQSRRRDGVSSRRESRKLWWSSNLFRRVSLSRASISIFPMRNLRGRHVREVLSGFRHRLRVQGHQCFVTLPPTNSSVYSSSSRYRWTHLIRQSTLSPSPWPCNRTRFSRSISPTQILAAFVKKSCYRIEFIQNPHYFDRHPYLELLDLLEINLSNSSSISIDKPS
jgi:hypothetical protein